MAITGLRKSIQIGPTKYKYVYENLIGLRTVYKIDISRKKGIKYRDWFDDIEEAAIAVDKKLIEVGLKPVNKLKKIN